MPAPTVSLRLGYDIAIGIDPSSYEIDLDPNGRAWAFTFDEETHRHLTDAVERSLSEYRPFEDLEIAPGYIRVRFPSPDSDTDPSDLARAVKNAERIYNDENAKYEDTEVSFTNEHYAGTYDPGNGLTRENWFIRDVNTDDAPDTDDTPVWTYTRDDAGETALSPSKRFAFRMHVPFYTAKMYDSGGGSYETINLAVEWDRSEVKDHLRKIVEDLVPWPGDPRETIPRIAVYPTHVEIDYYDDTAGTVGGITNQAKKAFLKYNRRRPIDKERSPRGTTTKHPPIDTHGTPFAKALPHGKTAGDWIQEHGFDEIDGDAKKEEPEEDADGFINRLRGD